MKIFLMVIKRFNIHPSEIFKLSFEYCEILATKQFKRKYYEENCRMDERGFFWVASVPEWIEDRFCLDVLAGRVVLPKNYKRFLDSYGRVIF